MYIQLPNISALLPNELLLLYCFSSLGLSLYMAPPLLVRYKKCLHSFLNNFRILAHGHVVVPAVLLCGFHKHLLLSQTLHHILFFFFFTHKAFIIQHNIFFLAMPCLSYRTSHATGIVGQARLFINSAVWPGRIYRPTALPGGHTRLSGQALILYCIFTNTLTVILLMLRKQVPITNKRWVARTKLPQKQYRFNETNG